MSSELFLFGGPFFRSSSSDMISSDADLQFLSEHFHPFAELPFDILNAFSDDPGLQIPADPSPPTHQSPYDIVSCSPPSQQLDNLSLSPTTSVPSAVESAVGNTPGLFVLDDFGVKAEGDYMNFNNFRIVSTFSNGHGTGKGTGMMQRSFSSQSLDRKPSFFQPCFNPLMETPSFQFQPVSSNEKSKTSVPMRRVCSTGDLQRIKGRQPNNQFSSCPLSTENSFTEQAGFKVGRYSAEERKQRIDRYRGKRNQRNFNKIIKYACRKTLADSRLRVRGRFARSDETAEIPKVKGFNRDEEDEHWIDGFHEDEEATMRAGFTKSLGNTRPQ